MQGIVVVVFLPTVAFVITAGLRIPQLLEAILKLFPLDTYVEHSVKSIKN